MGISVCAVALDPARSARKKLEKCAGDASRYFLAENAGELRRACPVAASQLSNPAMTE
ncbi:hypothetical protein [Henriciella mobilis]|uniref:hypothetical protein n=1 Tax=Henriciella mobilis TaxID=2305467 RepID=UPI001314548F|nr:hypothetical protein [Henriciella mobilis]